MEMPKQENDNSRKVPKKLKQPAAPLKDEGNSDSLPSEEELDDVPRSTNGSDSDSGKSLLDLEGEPTQDFSGGMLKLIERFQSDLSKIMIAKRKKLEQFTQESTKSTAKKVLETNKIQSTERKRLIDEFQTQLYDVIKQGESEMEKSKDADEKLQKVIIQHQKHQQQKRIADGQRLKALKDLSETFCKVMNELEENHIQQYSAVHNELIREMAVLQKKLYESN